MGANHTSFVKGHKAFSPGRPKGAKNKPYTASFLEKDPGAEPTKRFLALMQRMAADLGGAENLAAGELQLIRRAAMISVQCEQMEQRAVLGEPFDLTIYATATGHLGRTLKLLGLKRVPREDMPNLRDYLNAARQPNGAFAVEVEEEGAVDAVDGAASVDAVDGVDASTETVS
jgi:hypothetical protein